MRGLRITVYDVLAMLSRGMTVPEILADFPELEAEDISAVVAYAADREHPVHSVAGDQRDGMTQPGPRRALARKPSSNPTWATLESLAIDYLALPPVPPAPPEPPVDPVRVALRKKILHRLMGTFVQVVADDVMQAEADDDDADSVSDIALGDGAAAPEPSKAESAPPSLLRRDSALELVLRAEAKKLALRHGNDGLVKDFGGMTNLGAEAQQGFARWRLDPERKRQRTSRETLLTGLLNDWDSSRGSLYTFISHVAANFLIDMARQQFGGAENDSSAVGLASDAADDSASADSQPPRAGKPRVPRSKTAEPLSATPANWDSVEARYSNSDDAAAWLDQHMPHQAPSPEDLLAETEMGEALHAAVQTLPAELSKLFELELLKHEDSLSDDKVAKLLGCSRNTLLKHRARLHQALRQHLGESARPT